jgi:hypothetical protein
VIHSRDTAAFLWSARYPCQVSVSDSPPDLTLSEARPSGSSGRYGALDATHGHRPYRWASRTLRQPRLCDVLWSARYPCRVSDPDRPPVLSLPGALTFTTHQGGRRNCRRPAPSSPAYPGSTTAGATLATIPLTVPRSSQAHLGFLTAETLRRNCGVHATPARSRFLTARRSNAFRIAGSFASRCGH